MGYRLRITTPSAVAGVRGTDFFVSHNPNTAITEQATIEGTVEVQRAVKLPPKTSSDGPNVFEKPTSQIVRVTGGKQVTVASLGIAQETSDKKTKEKQDIPAPPPLKVVRRPLSQESRSDQINASFELCISSRKLAKDTNGEEGHAPISRQL